MTQQKKSQDTPDDPWARRDAGMRCATCLSFVPKSGDHPDIGNNGGVQGRCRRNAPTMRGFPVVFETDWCGEHRLA